MIFAEFYQTPFNWDGKQDTTKLIPACGDRSVLILDGRERMDSWHVLAREWAVKHKYKGYKIMRGVNILRGVHEVSALIELPTADGERA